MGIRDIDMQKFSQLVSDRIQHLIIFPTEQCNFRCTYCYEDFSIGHMSNNTILGIKRLLNRRASELDALHLSWFGGEPLVAKNIVFDISSYASSLAKTYGFKYNGSMTTNGYNLTPSTLSELTSVGVRHYQISLDGPCEIHNRTRIRKDGKGTFNRIWNNLLSIRDSKESVSILLRVHIDAEKITQIDPLIEDIRNEFIQDKRFRVLFKEIKPLGGQNDDYIKTLSLKQEEKELTMLNNKLFSNDFVETKEIPDICYAALPNSLTIRADGRIGKCTVALNDPCNHIGVLNSDGTLKINQNSLTPWLRGLCNLDFSILECPYANIPTK